MRQVCRWEFLVFSGTFETKLMVEEDLPCGTVVFHLVSSSFMRHFEGRWQVCKARLIDFIQFSTGQSSGLPCIDTSAYLEMN